MDKKMFEPYEPKTVSRWIIKTCLIQKPFLLLYSNLKTEKMILLKIIGLAVLMGCRMFMVRYFFEGFYLLINSKKVDRFLNPSVTPYNYKPEELWEPPTHWKNWNKTK